MQKTDDSESNGARDGGSESEIVHQSVENDEASKGKLGTRVFVVFDKIDKSDNWSTEISLESDINICPSELG